jgi:adenine-specific DNA-methyltransferase
MLHTSTQDMPTHHTTEDGQHSVPKHLVFRPIQYLGSKLRSLDYLLSYTKHLFNEGDVVVDCFSGSSVVSQAFANGGAKVVAVDSQQFCQHIASAMLGVARLKNERCVTTASALAKEFISLKLSGTLGALLGHEQAILSKGPSGELVDFYNTLPQVWKCPAEADWFTSAIGYIGRDGFNFSPIISSHYAGTYFGLHQALFFDYVRNKIHDLREFEEISAWTETALLTALYSAMSTVVCSAGKHFAQPLAAKTTGNSRFRIVRLHADRSIDCIQAFEQAAHSIDESAQLGDVEHFALEAPIDSAESRISELKPSLLYADPPYTAQQYSRFYHVLEVTAKYQIPELQLVKGKVTSGIYNVNRFKSLYSSKLGAPQAFKSLAALAKESGSSLAISYSASSEQSTGNSRMIALPQLSKICKYYFGNRVKIVELSHSYRPFNSDGNNNALRDDPEILIICEA